VPTSWEYKAANRLQIGILHTEGTSVGWAFGLRNLMIPNAAGYGEWDLRRFPPIEPITGQPFDHARNSIVKIGLERGAEWIGMLDSDVICPRDAFLRLMAHNLPVVSGMYCRRSPPHTVPVMQKNGQWHCVPPNSGLHEVDLVGAGILLIHRSVLESLPPLAPGKPWFHWKVDLEGLVPQGEALSEDFAWNLHIRKHGYKIICDSSVHCKHVGLGESTYLNYQPHTAQPVT
jgi:hypothetical protein